MKKLRETSLQIRLASITILGLLIALAAVAYFSGRQVQNDSDLIAQDAVPGTINAHYMRMAMSRSIGWVLVANSAQTTELRDASLKIVHDADVSFADAFKQYETTILVNQEADRALLDHLKSTHEEFCRQRMAYEALILSGNHAASAAFLEHELIPAFLPAIKAAEDLLKYNHGNSISFANSIRRSVNQLYWALAIVMVLALASAAVLVFNLTIRRRELADLLENEEKFSKAFRANPSGIAITELESGRYIEVNDSFCGILGYPQQEIIGFTTLDKGVWSSEEERCRFIQPLLNGGQVRNQEIQARTRYGIRKTLSLNAELIELRGRRCIMTLIEDITERREFERKQAEIAAIVESSEDAIIGKTLEGVVSSWNRGAEKTFGYTAAEAIGQKLLMLFPPESHNEESEILAKIARGETVKHFETVRVCKDGRRIFISATISPLRDCTGKVIGASKIARDITAHKQAAEALRESEERIRILGDNLPSGMMYQLDMGPDGRERRFTYVSAGVEKLHEVAVEAVMQDAQVLYGQIDQADLPLVATREAEALASMQPFVAELRMHLPSGAVRWGLLASAPRHAASGHVLWDGIELDITEQKQAELRIRHLNRVYEVLGDINQTIVREKDPQAMLTNACQIAVEKGGFRMAWVGIFDAATQTMQPVASAGVVEGYLDLVNIDLRDKARSSGPSGRSFLSGEHVICIDVEHDPLMAPWREEMLKRGYRSSASFPLKVGGKINGVFTLYSDQAGFFNEEEMLLLDELAMDIGFALEVSEGEVKHRQAEQELRWRTAFFEAQVHSSIDGILVLDSTGRKLLQNRRMNELWKIPPLIADDPDDAPQFQYVLGRVKEPEYFVQKTAHLNAHPDESSSDVLELVDGTILERYSAPVRGSDGLYYGRVWTFHDITERKKLEAQFLRAQRMESMGTLASGVAHDLNNILTPIMMSMAMLRMGIPEDKRANLYDTIEMSAARGAQIVKQVLTFGRGLDGEKHPLQIGMLITEMEQMIRSTFPKDITVECVTGPRLRLVLGDATQLHQVLLNLCVNARDAMPKGGTLRLSATNLDIDDSYASMLPETVPGQYVLLEVGDTGSGIPPEILERIFDPFFTTKGLGKGTGLGLSTVHGIVKSHSGLLKVASECGVGTTFQIYLPAASDQAVVLDSDSSATPPTGHGELVLVVDDEPAITHAARTVLEANGYRVLLANDGAEALAALSKNMHDVAVVLTDVMMPVMNGVLLLRTLRMINAEVPVIGSTGLAEKAMLDQLNELHVESVLRKPYNAGTLLRAIHGALHPDR